MTMTYNKKEKCFEISGAFTHSSSYEGDTLSTDLCPLNKEYCRKFIIGVKGHKTLTCDKFVGTQGEEYHRTYPVRQEDINNFKILCKGSNSMDFITED